MGFVNFLVIPASHLPIFLSVELKLHKQSSRNQFVDESLDVIFGERIERKALGFQSHSARWVPTCVVAEAPHGGEQ